MSYPVDVDDYQEEFGAWANRTFGSDRQLPAAKHLAREVIELQQAIEAGDEKAIENEAGDCLGLLLPYRSYGRLLAR